MKRGNKLVHHSRFLACLLIGWPLKTVTNFLQKTLDGINIQH